MTEKSAGAMFETDKSSMTQKASIDWNRFTRREERDTEDEDSDEAHIIHLQQRI